MKSIWKKLEQQIRFCRNRLEQQKDFGGVMTYRIKRPQNECLEENCKYKWMPKGKDRSNKCPNCGSRNVRIVPVSPLALAGCLIFFVIIIIIFIRNLEQIKQREQEEREFAENKKQIEQQLEQKRIKLEELKIEEERKSKELLNQKEEEHQKLLEEEIKTSPNSPEVKQLVSAEDVEKAKKFLKEAKKLGNQVQYKKAYERLKEAFELQIDETLLEECRSLHSKYQNYDNLTNLIEPITSEDGTLDRLVFSNGKEIFGKVIEEDEDNITFEQSNGIRGKIPRHRLAQIEELSSEKVQIRFLREFRKKKSLAEKNIEKFYELVEYACQYRLYKELHSYLEENYEKDPRFLEPLLQEFERQKLKNRK